MKRLVFPKHDTLFHQKMFHKFVKTNLCFTLGVNASSFSRSSICFTYFIESDKITKRCAKLFLTSVKQIVIHFSVLFFGLDVYGWGMEGKNMMPHLFLVLLWCQVLLWMFCLLVTSFCPTKHTAGYLLWLIKVYCFKMKHEEANCGTWAGSKY